MEEKITELRRQARNDRVLAVLGGATAVAALWMAFSGQLVIGLLGFVTSLAYTYRLLEIANKSQDKSNELSQRNNQLRRLKGEETSD